MIILGCSSVTRRTGFESMLHAYIASLVESGVPSDQCGYEQCVDDYRVLAIVLPYYGQVCTNANLFNMLIR